MIGKFSSDDLEGTQGRVCRGHQNTTNLIRSLLNRRSDFGVETITDIDSGGSLFKDAESFDQGWGQSFSWSSNIKVFQRSE